MTTTRIFIAIELSDEAQLALTTLQNKLKPRVPPHSVRWTAPQNFHLTLHFLGDVSTTDIEKITGVLRDVSAVYRQFSLSLGQLGCFPNTRRPRVIWVGVSGKIETLKNLHQELGMQLKAVIGFAPETRPYAPHLTLGRVKNGIPARHLSQLSQMLEQEKPNVHKLIDLQVREISLIKSELKPTGAVYTPISQGKFEQSR